MDVSITSAIPPAAAVSSGVSPSQARERTQLRQAVSAINDSNIFGLDRELTFSVDRATHQTVIRVVDRETHETIMQIPADYVLRMAEALQPSRQSSQSD